VTFGIGASTKGKLDGRGGINVLQGRGGSKTDEVTIVNDSVETLTLRLYAADALNGVDGSLQIQPASVKAVDAASWVTFATPSGTSSIVLAPRQRIVVPFLVRIPKNAPVGDHAAGLVVSLASKGQATGGKSADVDFEQRVALRLGVRVAGQLEPKLAIEGLTASYVGTLNPAGKGYAHVVYTVRNTGNVRLGAHQQVTVHGLVGAEAKAVGMADVPVLLPGGSALITVDVPDVWPMIYMTADVQVIAMPPSGDADPVSDIETASAHFWAIPWTVLALIFLLALLGGWWWRRRRATPPVSDGRRERGGRGARDEGVLVGAAPAKEVQS
jgi:hypothetical protein